MTSAVVSILLTGIMVARIPDPARARTLAVGAATLLALVGSVAAVFIHGTPVGVAVADPLSIAFVGARRPVLALDALNGPLLAYSAVVVLAALLGTPRRELTPAGAGAALIHLSATWTLFLTLDLGVLAAAYILGLVPALPPLERGHGRSARRLYLLYLFGSATMVALAIVIIGYTGSQQGLESPLSLVDLSAHGLGGREPWLALPFLLVGVILRKGAFPFHSWIPALSERLGPVSLVLLTAPQVGAFVLVRVAIPLFPEQLEQALPVVARIALIAALYGAVLGLVARNLRRAFGWIVVSQSSLVLVGLECTTADGVAGGLTLWFSVGLALTGLALATAAIESRIGQRSLETYAGLASRAPWLGAAFLVLGLTSVGLPGSLGFVAEDLLVHGALESYPGIGAAIVIATACNGFTIFRAFARVFYGPPAPDMRVSDLLPRERIALFGLVVLLIGGGFLSRPIVESRAAVGTRLASILSSGSPGSRADQPERSE